MLSTLFFSALFQISSTMAVGDDLNAATDAMDSIPLPKIEVRSQRTMVNYSIDSSLAVINTSELQLESPAHPNEIFDRVPGAWINRGSGQEHLTAIRSPVLTGAGACGAFMLLEDQVPTRPSGFCNLNQLFEVNLAQAGRIDVLRGPGTVTYGSNAVHGAVSVFTPGPLSTSSNKPVAEYSLEVGGDEFYRGMLSLAGFKTAMQANFTDAGSFRDDEHYQHGLFNFQANHSAGNASGRTSFAYAKLDQDTAGFILGKEAYKDPRLRTQNLNPDAFRKAWAVRISSRWNWYTAAGTGLELIPYARSSRMDFLQHFLPGTPLEKNGQDSFGLLMSWSSANSLSAGLDVEWAEGSLTEFQENALESDSAFLNETRPQGFHYNYRVRASTVAAWLQWQHDLSAELELSAGVRAEYINYSYDNHMLDGNTRDDGSVCGFGGCLYTRPADRSDSFTNLSPELGLTYRLNAKQSVYLRAARGYRAPQATELYRLQKGQTIAELEPVILDSVEVGFNGYSDKLNYELVAYAMRKENFIFRDANGFNVSDGKSRHHGVEALVQWQLLESLSINSNISWARHEYNFNRDLGSSGIILKGNEIDTAPPWLGALRLNWQAGTNQHLEAEWIYQGDYFLDAANAHKYPGHSLLNLRGWVTPASLEHHRFTIRLSNVLDERYAERADFAFGNYRYFPGMGRRLSLEWSYRR